MPILRMKQSATKYHWKINVGEKNGVIVVKKWNHGSEYVVNIVLPPSTELVACPHATWHGS